MKTKFTLIMFCLFIIAACSDDEPSAYKCKDCADTPEALAINDNSGKGIYKGLVIGSSGTMKFNIGNDGTYSATLSLDGETYELTTDDVFNEEGGFQGTFYGTMNTTDDIEIEFYTDPTGSFYYIDYIDIPGHDDAYIDIYKETSDALVRVFEGEYKGDASGTFNMIVQGSNWSVAARDDQDPTGQEQSYFEGIVNSNEELVCDCGDVEITGSIDGDSISGDWVGGNEDSGTWSGKRTL